MFTLCVHQRDTNRELRWLQEIKKAHGSVEVTSLMQTEAINAAGVYNVGRDVWQAVPDAPVHSLVRVGYQNKLN